eukprot:CAMPEP_0179298598 /NCGR_PEP_ID=MMETSP0797-20121207/46073_1 /TAXON_ID=47934 /ORGANISM="Dinophysis acuminata, Strain DAEP01" /LENGTH=48 /DNA_ID= /DNA_START= /DNA_END= /DNA_ORIENTATION=
MKVRRKNSEHFSRAIDGVNKCMCLTQFKKNAAAGDQLQRKNHSSNDST